MGFAEMLIQMNISYNSQEAVRMAEEVMKFITQAAREESAQLGEERGSFPLFEESKLKKWSAMRNATVTTIAPTGTISIIAGTSSGIEPLFALAFVRHVLEGAHLLEVSPLFEQAAAARGIYTPDLKAELARKGSAAGYRRRAPGSEGPIRHGSGHPARAARANSGRLPEAHGQRRLQDGEPARRARP